MQAVEIKTQRLLLRPFLAKDKWAIKQLAGNINVADKTLHIPHPYTVEMAEAWLTAMHIEPVKSSHRTYAITDLGSQQLFGAIGLIEEQAGTAKLGYWLGEAYWNQGYCSEATAAMLQLAFADLGLQRVYAEHLASNPASGRVMQKNTMQHAGQIQRRDRNDELVKVELYEISQADYGQCQC